MMHYENNFQGVFLPKRSNYENKEGKSPVMLRVFFHQEMADFDSMKIFMDKSLWNNTSSRLRGRTAEALSVNAALDSIPTTLEWSLLQV